MLHEYRDLIAELRQADSHFKRIFDDHNALDEAINNLESNPVTAVSAKAEIEEKKRAKLALKDEILMMLRKAKGE